MSKVNAQNNEEELLSVGEFAKVVGVSIRTLQFYDQKGLLSPSAKGPQNQRLYSMADRERLYHILVMKYLGYSLKDIDASLKASPEVCDTKEMFEANLSQLEVDFDALFKRMTVLRDLNSMVAEDKTDSWTELAHVIEKSQTDASPIWAALCVQEENVADEEIIAGPLTAKEKKAWHMLMFDTIRYIHGGGKPDSAHAADLLRRYDEMGGMARAQMGRSMMVLAMGNSSKGLMNRLGIDGLMQQNLEFFEQVRKIQNNLQ
ncbi:MAG: MerR family transcriptional regulator [Eggerthellaceae bacterium]|nr:MerR family transcriptional regulator [Eggerthellaceae bacterium]